MREVKEVYRITIYNLLIHNCIGALTQGLNTCNNRFYAEHSLLDPKNFNDIKKEELKSPVLVKSSDKLLSLSLMPLQIIYARNLRSQLGTPNLKIIGITRVFGST